MEGKKHLLEYIENYRNEGIVLTTHGYVVEEQADQYIVIDSKYIDDNFQFLELLASLCRLTLKKLLRPTKQSSYGLKHKFEEIVGYVSNGQLIAALTLAGFICRPTGRRQIGNLLPNAEIYCKEVENEMNRGAAEVLKQIFSRINPNFNT